MSVHSVKSQARHPSPQKAARERFEVCHFVVEVCDHPEHGKTFALKVGDEFRSDPAPALFSAHIEKGMATQLRKLAHRIDELEAKL